MLFCSNCISFFRFSCFYIHVQLTDFILVSRFSVEDHMYIRLCMHKKQNFDNDILRITFARLQNGGNHEHLSF